MLHDTDVLHKIENLIREYMMKGAVKSYTYNNVHKMIQEYFNEYRKKCPEINNEITPQNCWLARELDNDRLFTAPGKSCYGNATDLLHEMELTLIN